MPKNKQLQEALLKYETEQRAKEDNQKYIPRYKWKTSEMLDFLLKHKKKRKQEVINKKKIEDIYATNRDYEAQQAELVAKNKERRAKKYKTSPLADALKKLLHY